jgi:type VI protein secretion system component VasF
MQLDEESNLQAAFAELHRRQQDQAPPFGAMRERVMREANRRPATERRLAVPWIRWAVAAGCVITTAVWWIGWQPASRQADGADSLQRLEQLLTAIEQQVEFHAPTSSPDYPTDLLLTSHQTESYP